MTTGKPVAVIWSFTLPVMLGNVFQYLYSAVDTIIVGKFVGTMALAAVGSTSMIVLMILRFLQGMTTGFTVLTGQRYGAGDMTAMRKTVGSAAILSAIMAVLLTAGSLIFMKPLLDIMNTPADIYEDAYGYIMIICAGTATQVLYNLLSNILLALGNSKTPLYFLLFSAGLNVGLDLLLIIVFHMGVPGAAYATVISQGVSGLLCLLYIVLKVPVLRLSRSDLQLDGHVVKIQLSIGFPMALQNLITAIGSIIVQSSLNLLGSLHVASYTAAQKIEQVVNQVSMAMGTTMANYCAQNTGAKKMDRIRQGFRAATWIGFATAAGFGILTFFWGYKLTGLFVSDNVAEVSALVDTFMKCMSFFYFPLNIINIYRNGIQGMGYRVLPVLGGVMELTGRVLTSWLAAHYHSYTMICLSNPAAWVLAGSFFIVFYFVIIRNYKRTGKMAAAG